MNAANQLDKFIKEHVAKILEEKTLPDVELIETDSIGETVEKLVILHIRTWMLEDAVQSATTDQEIAELKKKIDICFKQKRPKLVQAFNTMLDNAILNGRSLKEDSVKLYKGVEND